MDSDTVDVPSLFHLVVVYFLRPSGRMVSVVVSVPGRMARGCSLTVVDAGLDGLSPDDCCNSASSCSLGGSRIVTRPAINETIEAARARADPHQNDPLKGAADTSDANTIKVNISKALPTIKSQPHLRKRKIS